MFKNYLKIAWRSIKKDKLFTFIKIGGFAVGIAACLLITLFISDELSYDTHYKNKDQIYRVVMQGEMNGEVLKSVHFQLPFADALESDFPEIIKSGKYNTSELFGAGSKTLRLEGQSENYFEEGFVFADQDLLEILEVPLLEGNSKTVLNEPFSIVVSESKAKKYYPNGNALGKTLVLDNNLEESYTITGIMEDPKTNSHFKYNFLMEVDDDNMSWTSTNYFTYVLVDEKADIPQLEKKMHAIIENYFIPAQGERGRSKEFMEVLKTLGYKLQPVSDIHLKSDIKMGDRLKHGDIRFVWLFGGIALFVLLLACINFINLSTAKSANRAKEVGLRKTVGAFKSNLVSQFLTESILFSLLSFIIGVLLAWALLPFFNLMAEKSLLLPWNNVLFLPILFVSAVVIGLIAGLYPAFYLSSFNPSKVLKGSLSVGSKSGRLRSGLVVFQFATSIILIIGTLVIYQQMDYIMNKKLGYDKEQVLVLQSAGSLGDKVQTFKKRLLELNGVSHVTISDYLPVEGTKRNGNTFKKIGAGNQEKGVPAQIWRVDYDYVPTLGLQINKGRNFSREFASDSTGMIVNAQMVKELGYENPIGKQISNGMNWTIVGVVDNFHFKNLKEDMSPLTMVIGYSPESISVKLKADEMSGLLTSIKTIWQEYVPNQAFGYSFLNQDFKVMHADVTRMGKIFNSFALFAILVACLGLFGLSTFMIEQRKKEISIRLVLGAPFKSIYQLLTLDFLKLILISILVAVPIGWYMMSRWLEDFAYRITIGWEIFTGAAVIALIIAVLTISYQSIGAALIKPLKSLRTE